MRAAIETNWWSNQLRWHGMTRGRISGENSQIHHVLLRTIKWAKGENDHWLGQNVGHWLYSFLLSWNVSSGVWIPDKLKLTWTGDLTSQRLQQMELLGLAIKFHSGFSVRGYGKTWKSFSQQCINIIVAHVKAKIHKEGTGTIVNRKWLDMMLTRKKRATLWHNDKDSI